MDLIWIYYGFNMDMIWIYYGYNMDENCCMRLCRSHSFVEAE